MIIPNEAKLRFEDLPTPYFLIDKESLSKGIDDLSNAIKINWPNTIIGYSFKTNSLPWIVNYMKTCGFRAEVVSDDEYDLAKYLKYDIQHIIYNGIAKSQKTFIEALENGAIVNIDSTREIDWLRNLPQQHNYGIGIRVNFDLEHFCPGESACGDDGGRFGFCYENGELGKALEQIYAIENVKVEGIHLHCSSKTRSIRIYKAITDLACIIKKQYNLHLSYVDVGGGFYRGIAAKPDFMEYFHVIRDGLLSAFNPHQTALIVEPGMSIIGPSVEFITSVIDVKQTTYSRFVITDGSRINIDPLMTKSKYFYRILQCKASNIDRGIVEKQSIVGNTCMEHDRLFELSDSECLVVGDKIIYCKVGAYTMCLSPLFIKYYPDVYVLDDNMPKLVRESWKVEEYLQKSYII